MEKEIIDEILASLDEQAKNESCSALFSDKRYSPRTISKEGFRSIKKELTPVSIAFIDGGNAEIISAPNISLQFVRTYFSIFRENKKTLSEKHDFYVFTKSSKAENTLKFTSKLIPVTKNPGTQSLVDSMNTLSFDSDDKSLSDSVGRVSISKIGDCFRRFLEIKTAERAVEMMSDGDFVVLDGTLQATMTNENEILSSLFQKGTSSGVVVTALAKTSRLFTDTGYSLNAFLKRIEPAIEPWYYSPVADFSCEEHRAEISLVKLNKSSRYVFRFEIFEEQAKDLGALDNLFSNLALNAREASFPGYPYGLIDADKFARVSDAEKAGFKVKLASIAGKDWEKILSCISSVDAHEILDGRTF